MKQFLKIFMVTLTVMSLFAACKKLDSITHNENGNKVDLSSSATNLAPAVADSNNAVVSFTWSNPNYATDTANFKFVLEIDSVGRNFSQAVKKIVVGANSTTLTGRELNAILLGYGFTIGAPYNMEARVLSSYGNNNEQYESNTVNLSVSAFNDPPSFATSATDVTLTLATAADPATTFTWTQAFTGYSGTVTYTIEYDLDGAGFASPDSFDPDPSTPFTTTPTVAEVNQAAINAGITPGGDGILEYRLKAVTALGAVSYSNVVTIHVQTYISLLRFYMPGGYQAATGNGNDWDPPTAPQLVRDQRAGLLNNMYYIYIYLPANAEFKFTQGASWTTNYGTGATPGTLAINGGNLSVPTAGWYRISINRTSLEYNIMQGRMGFVGGAVGAGWSPPDVFPNYALGNSATNLFVGLTDFVAGGWKLIDNDAWNSGSNAVDETRSYGTPLPDGGTLETNGANFADITTPGRYRAIWDGRDVDNTKYFFSPATEMRIVGNGLTGVPDWDPGASPAMTYSGNGVWTITLPMDANEDFKFVAGNAWGAFDYEDNSSQSQATGVAKKIKWEGGDNFKTPATAGSYTITLNENAQTVTVN